MNVEMHLFFHLKRPWKIFNNKKELFIFNELYI